MTEMNTVLILENLNPFFVTHLLILSKHCWEFVLNGMFIFQPVTY